MSRLNLHLFLSPILNETRLVKESRATLELGVFDRVCVMGLWDQQLSQTETLDSGLEVRRVRTLLRRAKTRFPNMPRGVLTKILGVLSFFQYGLLAILQAVKLRPSHISCHNLMLLPIAWVASMVGRSRLVYVPHELEVERTGLRGYLKKVAAWSERRFIYSCSAVVVVCEPIARWYRDRYSIDNVFVVRAIPEKPLTVDVQMGRDLIREQHGVPKHSLLFIYQGVLGKERGVDELIETFKNLDDSFHLMLMGYGEAVERIKAAEAACSRIHFQPAVPVDKIIQYSCAADVGVVVLKDPLSLSYRLSLPNKFFEYVYAGLPVLVSNNLTLLTEIVESNKLGWVTSTEKMYSTVKSFNHIDVRSKVPSVSKYAEENTWNVERMVYKSVYS